MKNFKKILANTFLFCSLSTTTLAAPIMYENNDGVQTCAEISYPYNNQALYVVNTQVNRVTDILLGPNEQFLNAIAGDTEQWYLDKATVGNITHIYLKPLENSIATNFVINTDKNSYHIIAKVNKVYNPIIRFDTTEVLKHEYEQEELQKLQDLSTKQLEQEQANLSPENLKEYKITPSKSLDKKLLPKRIYTDGIHTYIDMPNTNYDLPILYNYLGKNLSLINYRIKDKTYIADKVITHGRLQYTADNYVEITSSKAGVNDEFKK